MGASLLALAKSIYYVYAQWARPQDWYCKLDMACAANVSVSFGAKKDRGTGFSVLAAQEKEREPKNERWGGGREGKKLFQTNPGF